MKSFKENTELKSCVMTATILSKDNNVYMSSLKKRKTLKTLKIKQSQRSLFYMHIHARMQHSIIYLNRKVFSLVDAKLLETQSTVFNLSSYIRRRSKQPKLLGNF